MKKILTCIVLLLAAVGAKALEVGKWTHYISYNKLTHVVPTDNEVFAVSDGRLFSCNVNDESMTPYGTGDILSDNTDITDICWNRQTKCLMIAYEDGNLDMLDTRSHRVVNCSAIMNEQTTRSKTVRSMTCDGVYAYVVMPYGVIRVNTQRKEVDNTFRLNLGDCFTGALVRNDSVYLLANRQLTEYGNYNLLVGCLNDNLLDMRNWGPVRKWSTALAVYETIKSTMNGRRIYDFEYQNRKNNTPLADDLHHCAWQEADDGSLMKLRLQDDGTYAQEWSKGRTPDGPASNSFGHIHWINDRLYTASLGWRTLADTNEPGYVHTFNPSEGWRLFERPAREQTGAAFAAISDIAVDPRDTAHVMVSAKSGLYEYYGGRFVKRWYKENSPIKSIEDGPSSSYQMVLSAAYDRNGTLWVLNSKTSNALLRLDQTLSGGVATESTWQHMAHSEIDSWEPYDIFLTDAKWDKKGNLWFIDMYFYGASYYCYNPATDVLTKYEAVYNQDGSSLYDDNGDGYLKDINIDADGNVWLCGTKGVCYLPARNVGTATNVVEQYKIARNDGTGLADYLLSTVDANCIVFDGAGRKYIGTAGNGVYVISADNETEVENYTAENSGLLHDNVRSLAIDPQTGTLYCATERGLCSVTTDAVAVPASLDKDNIKVYPNPVAPSYTGMITLEGLTVGADIKITTATGYVVHTGRTQSAVYQWDGCDLSGNRCASGIYNVLIATEDASEGCVAKIAMVK